MLSHYSRLCAHSVWWQVCRTTSCWRPRSSTVNSFRLTMGLLRATSDLSSSEDCCNLACTLHGCCRSPLIQPYMHTKEKTNISYRLYHGVCKLWVFALYLVGCFDSTAVGSGFHVKTAMTFAWPTGVRMAWASTPHRWTLHSSPWALPKDPKRC